MAFEIQNEHAQHFSQRQCSRQGLIAALAVLVVGAFALLGSTVFGSQREWQNAPRARGTGPYPLRLIDLKKSPLARCMDGSPGSFYWKPASSAANASKWLVHFEGGGECVDHDACLNKAKSHLGSSDYLPRSVSEPTGKNKSYLLINPHVEENPDFYSWNMVWFNYCSADNWSGQRKTTEDSTFGWLFSGHHVLNGILDALDELPSSDSECTSSLRDATDFIVSGESAGGFGVYANANDIHDRYPNAHVVAAPFSGLYSYASNYTGPDPPPEKKYVDYSKAAWPTNIAFWQTRIDPECQAAHLSDPGACILNCAAEEYGWKFIRMPLFIMMSTTDKTELNAHFNFPAYEADAAPWSGDAWQFLREYHANKTHCLADAMSDSALTHRVGYFRPACWIHVDFTDDIKIQGRSYRQAFADFYFERGATPKLEDSCGELCNPTCQNINPPPPSAIAYT